MTVSGLSLSSSSCHGCLLCACPRVLCAMPVNLFICSCKPSPVMNTDKRLATPSGYNNRSASCCRSILVLAFVYLVGTKRVIRGTEKIVVNHGDIGRQERRGTKTDTDREKIVMMRIHTDLFPSTLHVYHSILPNGRHVH